MTTPFTGHIHRPRSEQLHVRQAKPLEVPNIEQEPIKYVALALVHLRNELANVVKLIQDHSLPFDEYQPQSLIPGSEMTINLLPSFEQPERVEKILITGPAGAVTVQLGDRVWNLTIPAAGYILIAPVAIFLGRDDIRQLTAVAAGNYTLELMGFRDEVAP